MHLKFKKKKTIILWDKKNLKWLFIVTKWLFSEAKWTQRQHTSMLEINTHLKYNYVNTKKKKKKERNEN